MLHCRRVDVLGTREEGEEAAAGRPARRVWPASVQGYMDRLYSPSRPLRFGGFLSLAWLHEGRRTGRYGRFIQKTMDIVI